MRLHPKKYIQYCIINESMNWYLTVLYYQRQNLTNLLCFWPPDIHELSSMLDLRCPDWPLHSHCLPHAQLPNITAQPLRSASEACYCMLIATCVVSRAKAALGLCFRFYSLRTTVSFFLSFPFSSAVPPRLPFLFSQMRNVVITEHKNLLTPKLDLWEGDIGDVRQCFTHVCLLSSDNLASLSIQIGFTYFTFKIKHIRREDS